jgi:hypothetical protein
MKEKGKDGNSYEWCDTMATHYYYDIITHNSIIDMVYCVTLITMEMSYISIT